jgi:hypothetical protein
MHSYNPANWDSFFVAVVGAAAGLTGLLFVAVSINLENILKEGSMLPARAAETLASLLFVMVSAALTLVPQNTRLLGAEILVIVLPLFAITLRTQIGFRRKNPDAPAALVDEPDRQQRGGDRPRHGGRRLPRRALGRRPLLAGADGRRRHRRRGVQRLGAAGRDRPLTRSPAAPAAQPQALTRERKVR